MIDSLPFPFPPVGNALPAGVELHSLAAHEDGRGRFIEVFRRTWQPDRMLLQWNAVQSRSGVLRGMHVHIHHDDYLTTVTGESVVGLRDLRRHSPTHGLGTLITLDTKAPASLFIPRGVAHGFLHLSDCVHLYGVSHYWDKADELACGWDDTQLNLPWPIEKPELSDRDRDAMSLADLLAEYGDRL